MRRTLRSLVMAAIIGAPLPVSGQQTSIDLYEKCQGQQQKVGELACIVYFVGFTVSLIASGAMQTNGICLPKGGGANQNRLVVNKYMAAHPERLHEYTAILILDALREAFPCK